MVGFFCEEEEEKKRSLSRQSTALGRKDQKCEGNIKGIPTKLDGQTLSLVQQLIIYIIDKQLFYYYIFFVLFF